MDTEKKSISEMSVSEIMAHLASIKDAEVKRLRAENEMLAAKIAANNSEITKITGTSEKASGKTKRNTKEAITAALSGGKLLSPVEIADAISTDGSVFVKDGLDRTRIVLYVHNTLKDSAFVRVDDSYGLAKKDQV